MGPNCLGVVNLEIGLNAMFSRASLPKAGTISLTSQSGGMGLSYLHQFKKENLGINKFISIGNKVDINESDTLEYLIQDDGTKLVAFFLESVVDGRKFIETARKSSKVIIVHKANITEAGHKASLSHTSALANDDSIVDSAFRQARIIRVNSMNEMVNLCKVFQLPLIQGNNILVISRSGGHCVIAADLCDLYKFNLPPLPKKMIQKIESFRRPGVIKLSNPLDFGDIFYVDPIFEAVESAFESEIYDAVVLLYQAYGTAGNFEPIYFTTRLKDIIEKYKKPVVFCIYTEKDILERVISTSEMPVFYTTEEALFSLKAMRDYLFCKY